MVAQQIRCANRHQPTSGPDHQPAQRTRNVAARQIAGIEQRRGARDHHAAKQAKMFFDDRAIMAQRHKSRLAQNTSQERAVQDLGIH